MSALLFGSISALADTSELQRQAFNDAFTEHGLDWHWDRDRYRALLTDTGGAQRIAEFADERGDDVDAEAVHATKSGLFQRRLRDDGADARPGVLDVMHTARRNGVAVALVTTTSPDNVDALLDAMGLDRDDFDVVVTSDDVDRGKPDPRAYALALQRLGQTREHCVAVEDNVGGVAAAADAGIPCIATPNANTSGHDFDRATEVVDDLDPAAVLSRLGADSSPA